ncbi:hypothetical protein [Legionella fallonii]|uniref:Uncharacterized protein n=1 Tax=Legionella fallonii LLAP-10 TaxID=1212491 RepID=A0A098G5E1_9GAMM|nr:hypothetical protein [Legionella fallonii]CEG57199.1 exported protein of unknown function [Legionella fallonii LLAP-10]
MLFLNTFNYIHIIPLLAILVLIISILAAIFIKPHSFQSSRTFVFISIMASLAVVILAGNIFLTTMNMEVQRKINNAQFTKQAIDKLWLYPNQLLLKEKQARPEFLASFYYNNPELYQLTKDIHTKPTIDSTLQEQYISIVLIQCWEDYLTLRELDQTGDQVWLYNFLQWAQSPYLKNDFETLKYNFAPTTIKFGELLFEYSAQIPVPTTKPHEVQLLIRKLIDDPRLRAIFKERSMQHYGFY